MFSRLLVPFVAVLFSAADPAHHVTSAAGPAPAATGALAVVPGTSGAPRDLAPADLMDLVPLETTSVWSWRSGEGTELIEERFQRVADAVLEARFDHFVLDVMDVAGAPPELLQELRSVRNVFATMGGLVPWRDLLGSEVVYAETQLSHLLPGTEMPGMLLACRPSLDRAREVEDSLAGFLGAIAGTVGFLRYDIQDEEWAGTRRYELVLRNDHGDRPLIQVAADRGVILVGMGPEYFDRAVDLFEGGVAERLTASERYQHAFEGLPSGASGRSFVDVSLLVEDLDELSAVLADRSFNSGLWQGFLNGALDVAGTVDTLAATTRCAGTEVVTETLTRFDSESPSWVRAGLTGSSSAELLEFVPADAVSFEMRGPVDLPGVFRWGIQRWEEDWAPAEDVVWVADVLQAVLGLSLENDLLPWLGDEHVSIQLPTDAGSETVMISRLSDEPGARKCLERAEGIFEAMAPRLVSQLQELLLEAQVPFSFDIQLSPGPRDYPSLRQLNVTAFPMLMKQMVFGTLDGYFVFATSEAALRSCLEVAGGRSNGLDDRPIAADLLGREDLCSASLAPMGAGVRDSLQMLGMLSGFLEGATDSVAEENPEAELAIHMTLDLLSRVETVLTELDFMGDAVTASEARDRGLARYERSTMHLRVPTLPPARPGAGEAPIADATDSTPW